MIWIMHTLTLRTWSDLSSWEKADIIYRIFATQNQQERNKARDDLMGQYWVSEWTINSLIANETKRRKKNSKWVQYISQKWEGEISPVYWERREENPTQVVQKSTQVRVYTITSLPEITEQMRAGITQEFSAVIKDDATDTRYDFYQDIDAISDYYNIDPKILEQFLRNRYSWLWAKLDELKSGGVLSDEEKMNIRLYVSDGIDEKDKKKRRKEMACKYQVSTYVIWAITAWKLGGDGWVVLRKYETWDKNKTKSPWSMEWIQEVPELVKPDQQSWEQHWDDTFPETSLVVQANPSSAEQTLDGWTVEFPTEAMSEWENVLSEEDVAFIQEFAWSFDLGDDEQRRVFLDDVFDFFPVATIDDIKKIITNFLDDTTHANAKRRREWMWALANYNNEIKNKWRQKLKEFIDENTEREKRKDMKVLCLPWVECLEIPLYLELWFKPENIIWVEAWIVRWRKDMEVIARFRQNAKNYWIQTRIGKLEKILETEEIVFDVVSLDFVWPPSQTTFIALNSIKINKEWLVLTNFLNKRESSAKHILYKYSAMYDPQSWKADSPNDNPYYGLWIYSHVEPVGKSTIYEVKMQWWLWRMVAASILNIQDINKSSFNMKYMPTLQDTDSIKNLFSYLKETAFIHPDTPPHLATYEVKKYIIVVVHKFLMDFLKGQIAHAISDKLINEMNGIILWVLTDMIIMKPWVLGHKLYNYKWENNSVMISDFLVLGWNWIEKKKNFKKLNYFFATLVELVMKNWIHEAKWEDIHSISLWVEHIWFSWVYQFGPKDNLFIKVDWKLLCQIKATDFFWGYDELAKYWQSIACNYSTKYTIIK